MWNRACCTENRSNLASASRNSVTHHCRRWLQRSRALKPRWQAKALQLALKLRSGVSPTEAIATEHACKEPKVWSHSGCTSHNLTDQRTLCSWQLGLRTESRKMCLNSGLSHSTVFRRRLFKNTLASRSLEDPMFSNILSARRLHAKSFFRVLTRS